MNGLLLWKSFFEHKETHEISANAIALYAALWGIQNTAGWPKKFKIRVNALCLKAGISNEKAVLRARAELFENGFIEYAETGGSGAGTYSLIPLYEKNYNNPKCDDILSDNLSDNLSDKIGGVFVRQTSPYIENKNKQNKDKSRENISHPLSLGKVAELFPQIKIDCEPIFTENEYRNLKEALSQSRFATLNFNTLQKLHKHAKKLLAEEYKDFIFPTNNEWDFKRSYNKELFDSLIDDIDNLDF